MPRSPRWTPVEQAKAVQERDAQQRALAQYPQLHLMVYATMRGVVLTARIDRLTPQGRLVTTQVARACWKPARVTERAVVDWGQRALSAWLAANPEETLEQEDLAE